MKVERGLFGKRKGTRRRGGQEKIMRGNMITVHYRHI
jgi:hypothetical protein